MTGEYSEKIRQNVQLNYAVLMNCAEMISDSALFSTKSVADQLLKQLHSDKIRTKVALVTYSDKAKTHWSFDSPLASISNIEDAANQINLITKEGKFIY